MVGRFVGRGTVLPARVLAATEAGRCRVELLGVAARLRARPDQRPGPAAVCLRSEDVRLATDAPGAVGAVVRRAFYEGGRTALELEPVGAPPGSRLILVVPEDGAPRAGLTVHVAIDDGWVLPEALGA
jgi:hypothetical protein